MSVFEFETPVSQCVPWWPQVLSCLKIPDWYEVLDYFWGRICYYPLICVERLLYSFQEFYEILG